MDFNIIHRNRFIIERGSHTENVILIVLDGSFSINLNNTDYTVNKNDIVTLRKGEYFERFAIEPLTIIYIQFADLSKIGSKVISFQDIWRQQSTIRFLQKSVETLNIYLCEYYLNDLLIQYEAENLLFGKSHSAITKKFISLVEHSYSEKISVKDFAKKSYITHTGFLIKFKKETGKTPIDFIIEYRMNRASELLLNTDYTINQIASLCGFDNVYYFSNAFKNRFSVSPKKFRENNI